MCTLALFFHEFEDTPLLVAANRDEFFSRPSEAPALVAEDPRILAGKDLLAGGTWLGVNDRGLLVGVLNRRAGAGRDPAAARSRGLLCLDLLKTGDPEQARALLDAESGAVYGPFNLLVVAADRAFVSHNLTKKIASVDLEPGLHVLGNASVYDGSKKIARGHALFSAARAVFSPGGDRAPWIAALQRALSDHARGDGAAAGPNEAICVHSQDYGTVSSSIVFYGRREKCFHMYYAPGPPCRGSYGAPLALEVR